MNNKENEKNNTNDFDDTASGSVIEEDFESSELKSKNINSRKRGNSMDSDATITQSQIPRTPTKNSFDSSDLLLERVSPRQQMSSRKKTTPLPFDNRNDNNLSPIEEKFSARASFRQLKSRFSNRKREKENRMINQAVNEEIPGGKFNFWKIFSCLAFFTFLLLGSLFLLRLLFSYWLLRISKDRNLYSNLYSKNKSKMDKK